MEPAFAALKTWMIISAILYLVGLLTFMFGPNLLLQTLNSVSQRLFGDRFPLLPLSTEKFWLVLTNSMMLMLIVCCGFTALAPQRHLMMVIVILASKAFSTAQYLVLFWQRRFFAYLCGALSDGPLFLITLYFFLRAV